MLNVSDCPVSYTHLAEMDPADWALTTPEKEVTPEIEVREDGATICNGKIRAEINLICLLYTSFAEPEG